MKKTILTVAFIATNILTSITSVSAQKGFQLGVEGTPQLSWLMNKDDKDNANFEAMTNFNGSFGITGQYGFTDNVGLGLNALYSFQGQRFKLNETERIKKIEYVKIPLLFIYNYDISTNVMFIAKIGPQVSLLMNARLTDKDGTDIVRDQKLAYEDFDIGAVANAGVGFKLTENLCLETTLRFDYGFTDAEDKDYKLNINNPVGATNGSAKADPERVITNNTTAGLTIGLKYLFK